MFFFFKQKTAYELRIRDWSSDVCSSDLIDQSQIAGVIAALAVQVVQAADPLQPACAPTVGVGRELQFAGREVLVFVVGAVGRDRLAGAVEVVDVVVRTHGRSEEHTSELQSLMRISYAVFCLTKKKYNKHKAIR